MGWYVVKYYSKKLGSREMTLEAVDNLDAKRCFEEFCEKNNIAKPDDTIIVRVN